MNVYKPEIAELLLLVEKKYGRALRTTTDFEEFSFYLQKHSLGRISTSTLKRLWGYVNDMHMHVCRRLIYYPVLLVLIFSVLSVAT